jgi:hypothetical protein
VRSANLPLDAASAPELKLHLRSILRGEKPPEEVPDEPAREVPR